MKFIYSLLCFFSLNYCSAQTTTANKLPADLVNFFIGEWTGEGEFASGKKISADVSFKLTLDSSWILYEHSDRIPNKYKATSMWGVDNSTGEFIAYSFDNFQGHRKFVSDGWKNGKLVLTVSEYYPQRGLFFQHFIYEKLGDKSFKMTFETSKDAVSWKMGDYLIFKKTSPLNK